MYSGDVLNARVQSILVYDNDRPRGKYRCFFDVLYFFSMLIFNVDFQCCFQCWFSMLIFIVDF